MDLELGDLAKREGVIVEVASFFDRFISFDLSPFFFLEAVAEEISLSEESENAAGPPDLRFEALVANRKAERRGRWE